VSRYLQRRRAVAEDGFTLIELLVVLVILAVLIVVAVSAYIGFKDRAADRTAQANLRSAMPSAEAYYADFRTYVGLDPAAMRAVDAGLSPTLTVVSAGTASYCIAETIDGRVWSVAGPGTAAPSYVNNGTCS
jgi:type IV pilus assembly protein PilA